MSQLHQQPRASLHSESEAKPADSFAVTAPAVQLPKGGGALRGIGEKFAANPVTGTASLHVPIATSPSRNGFGPQLALAYDSGAGNGPFGFGWLLALPSITRKTDQGLPRYQDDEDSDVFMLSGAEDLTPVFKQDAAGRWVRDVNGAYVVDEEVVDGYTVRRYRPRIEGLFARIERWTRRSDGSIHWCSISRDNVLTIYGQDENSQIASADAPRRIFSWLISETRDDKGNAVFFEYQAEDGEGVDLAQAHERNRGDRSDARRKTNRYLKRIRYGNRTPLLDAQGWRPRFLSQAAIESAEWLFEVVFDYGEHDALRPLPQEPGKSWPPRPDPFSSYRAGFEVRTYRLCQRVLVFHHFPDEAGVGRDCLVRSTDFAYAAAPSPGFSFLEAVTQCAYKRQGNGYHKRSLPPLAFGYSRAEIDEQVRAIDAASLDNLPVGLDGASYQWVDLDGEGLAGILTEQAGGWFYKPNLGDSRFGPLQPVAYRPTLAALGSGRQQLLDLAGDGQLDLVALDGPTPGFFERSSDQSWQPFQPFDTLPMLVWDDPNLRFVDLDGDGRADVLITEQNVLTWYPSWAEDGFGPAQRVSQAPDEEQGPRLVFADGAQSIYLADMCGDGLVDLVRIRNGEVCYWPNLGYGRFGAKVTMDDAPWFDAPDQFSQERVRLADIDGSGAIDIIYLGRDGVRLYFNQSGNRWSPLRRLDQFPHVDNLATVMTADLLGNGTACLVWSSPLPGAADQPLRFIDLMGGQKPHLLVQIANNLGAETHIEYAPSTKFYLADKAAGRPWLTRLAFPVHVVEKVTVVDKWRQTRFSNTYSYHHGYFDGVEREFRGFGRVEQVDSESYGRFASGNAASPYITDDKTLYQPPVKTVTWYHTGAQLDHQRILAQLADEYFPHWLEQMAPGQVQILGGFQEIDLPEPDLAADELSASEWREALRACKGMLLRQEVMELDVDALERGEQRPVKLFSTAYHTCHIRRLQPQGSNRHAVFLASESEAITYHYELDLATADLSSLRPDPRVAHTLNLSFDAYGHILQSVAAVYPRLGESEADLLPGGAAGDLDRIRAVQREMHLAYTETRYTGDYDPTDRHNYRLRVPCEVLTYELSGMSPEDEDDRATADLRDNRALSLNELRRFRLSEVHQAAGEAVVELPYHKILRGNTPQKRLVEHVRQLFFQDDPTEPAALRKPLPLGKLGRLALPYESYKLALTEDLLRAVFDDKLTPGVRSALADGARSGYLSGAALAERFPGGDTAGQYWLRSGIAGFADDAAQHFFLPERYADPFGNVTRLEYDGRYDLFVQASSDPLDNTTRVMRFDYRVLAPAELLDSNDNLSEVHFDVLGMPAALALKGKGNEGDNLNGFDDALANPDLPLLTAFFDSVDLDVAQASAWLGNATARHVYHFGEGRAVDGSTTWARHPACACAILRERHVSQLGPDEQSPLQVTFEYSDGLGSVVVRKVQAEPEAAGQPLRWVASGKTILNNKGQPVKQYEPYFSPPEVGHRYEEPSEVGVTPVIYYDALGRVVRTEAPDGSFSRVEFSPWRVRIFDQNDTATETGNAWFARMTGPLATADEQRAARLAAGHANTPAVAVLDSLGRAVVAIAHNRVRDEAGALHDERYLTFTRLDAEGKPLWIRDARQNLVIQYITPPAPDGQAADPAGELIPCYDIAGNLLFQHSMDAGDRWTLGDAAGQPLFAWDGRGHAFHTRYDALRRPVGSFVVGADPNDSSREIQVEKVVYGDTPNNGLANPQSLNLRGKPYQLHDSAGLVTSKGHNPASGEDEAFDFKGNLLRSSRQLAREYKALIDWAQNPSLETETWSSSTRFDALNRPIQMVAAHSNEPGAKINIIQPGYNEAGLLERVDAWLEQTAEPAALLNPATASLQAVRAIDYNAKGQRTRIEMNEAGRAILTEYTYDAVTYRLSRLLTTRPQHAETDKRRLQDVTYTYDPAGNITRIEDQAQPRVFFGNDCIDASSDYLYDALYRLVAATGREHRGQDQQPTWDDGPRMGNPVPYNCTELRRYVETYRYDAVGNILQMSHHLGDNPESPGQVVWNRHYQYHLDNNQLRCTSIAGEAPLPTYSAAQAQYAQRYSYDHHGNMTGMPQAQGLAWDYRDQLCQANLGGGGIAYYVYDSAGQRVRKVWEKAPGLIEERIYLGGCEVFRQRNGAGTITLERETLHIMDGQQRIALVETRTQGNDPAPRQLVRYQITNHLGSAGLEMDRAAQVISYEEYSPYGSTSYQAMRSQTETPKRYRYTGKERDEETGLAYHGARYFAPWLARWVSCDPAGLVDDVNLYQYALGNPAVLLDPSGTQATGYVDENLDYIEKGPGYTAKRSAADNYASPAYTFDELDLTAPLPKSQPAPQPRQAPKASIQDVAPPLPPPPQEKPVEAKPAEEVKPFDPYAEGVPIDKSWRVKGSNYLWEGTQEAFTAALDPKFSGFERYVMLQAASIGLAGSALEQLVLNPLLNAPADAYESGQLAARSVHRLSRGEYMKAYEDAKQAKDQFEGATLAVVSVALPLAKGAGVAKAATASEEAANALTKAEKSLLRSEARELMKASGRKLMPWQDVHHRIPLEFAHLFPAVEGAEEFRGLLAPNRLENLRVVNRPTHIITHMWWNYFKANYAIDAQGVTWAERQIASAMKWKAMP